MIGLYNIYTHPVGSGVPVEARPGFGSKDILLFYNIYTDTEPPRARPGPSRPSSASGGPPAAARRGGVTNPTAEHRDAVGRSEAYHLDLSTGACGAVLRSCCSNLFTLSYGTVCSLFPVLRDACLAAFSLLCCAFCGASSCQSAVRGACVRRILSSGRASIPSRLKVRTA